MLCQLFRKSASLSCTTIRQSIEFSPSAMRLHSAVCLLKTKDDITSGGNSQMPKHSKQQNQGKQPQQQPHQRKQFQPQTQTQPQRQQPRQHHGQQPRQHHGQQPRQHDGQQPRQHHGQQPHQSESEENKWDIKEPTEIQVISNDGKNLGFLSLATAQEKARKENLLLHNLGHKTSTGIYIYKLMTAEQIQLKNKPKTKKVQQNVKVRPDLKAKELRIRAGIGANDVKYKMAQLQKFLDAPYEVKLEISQVRKGHEDANAIKSVPLKDFCSELLGQLNCEVDVEVVTNKNHLYRCLLYKVS